MSGQFSENMSHIELQELSPQKLDALPVERWRAIIGGVQFRPQNEVPA